MKRLLFTLMLVLLLGTACQPLETPAPEASATQQVAPTSAPPTATPAPATQPAPTGTPIQVDLTPAQRAAEQALAAALNIPVEQITLVSTEAVEWPDGCLGIVLPGVLCVKGPVPGFRIILTAGGKEYEYHTNQDGSSILSTKEGFAALRIAVRAADNSVQVINTGLAPAQARSLASFMPLGGAVDGTVYALDFANQPQAQVVDAAGVRVLDFIHNPNYGLAVWPGKGSDQPRLAWGTPLSADTSQTQLFVGAPDGSQVTPVLTETIESGQAGYQLVAHRWSPDGQSLYFSREPYGIGGYIPFAGASSLYRYNVSDQSVTELIPFDLQSGKAICLDDLSADARLVAEHCADPKTITVRDLSGSQSTTLQVPAEVADFRLAGSARFSPDDSRVAYALAKGDPSGEQGWVAVSDGLSGASKLVAVSEAGRYFTVVTWLNANTLLLQENTLACNPTCVNSLWTVSTDGTGLTRVADGTFLTLVNR